MHTQTKHITFYNLNIPNYVKCLTWTFHILHKLSTRSIEFWLVCALQNLHDCQSNTLRVHWWSNCPVEIVHLSLFRRHQIAHWGLALDAIRPKLQYAFRPFVRSFGAAKSFSRLRKVVMYVEYMYSSHPVVVKGCKWIVVQVKGHFGVFLIWYAGHYCIDACLSCTYMCLGYMYVFVSSYIGCMVLVVVSNVYINPRHTDLNLVDRDVQSTRDLLCRIDGRGWCGVCKGTKRSHAEC